MLGTLPAISKATRTLPVARLIQGLPEGSFFNSVRLTGGRTHECR